MQLALYTMSAFVHFKLREHDLLLTDARSIYWEEQKVLIVSDLHLGKAGHFRKAGIGIPQTIFKEDLQRLVAQLQYFKPEHLLVVGDLFHSTDNKEHELFLKWRKDLKGFSIQLVKGNHDILSEEWYKKADISVHISEFVISDLIFTHDPLTVEQKGSAYYICGHIHPGILLTGVGMRSVRLPCFYFGKTQAILPAFGKFTGTQTIKPVKGDSVFAVMEGKIVKIQ